MPTVFEREAVLTSNTPSAQLDIVSSAFTQTELLQKEVRARAPSARLEEETEKRQVVFSSISVLSPLSRLTPDAFPRLPPRRARRCSWSRSSM